jgi:hypothetical protein
MWPFEEISGYFYYLANRKQYFSITIKDPKRFEKFSAYAPKGYTVKEWANLIHKKLEQYDLPPTYQHIGDMHTALFMWTMGCKDKQAILDKPLPNSTLFASPILKDSLKQIETTKAPRQIPQ